jgi:hypothetical protein
MLKALVEEMNRYGENPTEALDMLNAKPEYDEGARYDITLIAEGKEIKAEHLHPNVWKGNPLSTKGVHVEYDSDPGDDNSDWENFSFTPDKLINLNPQEGKFVFESKGSRLILTRVREKMLYDYSSLLV